MILQHIVLLCLDTQKIIFSGVVGTHPIQIVPFEFQMLRRKGSANSQFVIQQDHTKKIVHLHEIFTSGTHQFVFTTLTTPCSVLTHHPKASSMGFAFLGRIRVFILFFVFYAAFKKKFLKLFFYLSLLVFLLCKRHLAQERYMESKVISQKKSMYFTQKNLFFEGKRPDSGQTLCEFVCLFFVFFLCFCGTLEMMRLVAFQNVLEAATGYAARYIAHQEYDLLQNGILSTSTTKVLQKSFEDRIAQHIQQHLNALQTSLISFGRKGVSYDKFHDVRVYFKYIHQVGGPGSVPPGLYLETQTCLPVLFDSIFRHIRTPFHVGREHADSSTNCLGHWRPQGPLPDTWFRLRAAAYAPRPASSALFAHGMPAPASFVGMSARDRERVVRSVQEAVLTRLFP